MPLKWSFNQSIELRSQSRDVSEGVCMVMSYYVCKRTLAGLETTPDLLRRKMPLFASMQRAGDGDVKLSGELFVEMLARRDNLQARVGPPGTDFDGAIASAMTKVNLNPPPQILCMCLNLYWKDEGHSVVLGFNMKKNERFLFDPNIGLVSVENAADADLMSTEYENMSEVGCVVLWGAPRDTKFLASD